MGVYLWVYVLDFYDYLKVIVGVILYYKIVKDMSEFFFVLRSYIVSFVLMNSINLLSF